MKEYLLYILKNFKSEKQKMSKIHLIFDWGDTLMVDDKGQPGPMAYWPNVEWVKGARDALENLYKKFPIYIASNSGFSDTALLKKAFDRVDGEHFFTKIFASKDIGFEKPDSRFFQFIIDDLKIKPSSAIMIGNDYIKDICGGKIAGMKTVFLSDSNDYEKYPNADIIIDSMKDLPEAIEKLL